QSRPPAETPRRRSTLAGSCKSIIANGPILACSVTDFHQDYIAGSFPTLQPWGTTLLVRPVRTRVRSPSSVVGHTDAGRGGGRRSQSGSRPWAEGVRGGRGPVRGSVHGSVRAGRNPVADQG